MLLDTNILIALFDDEKESVDKVTDLTYQFFFKQKTAYEMDG